MAILSTGNTFGATDTVTSTKLNNIADAATFDDPVDDSTLELHTDGKLRIKDSGVTKAKIENVADMKVLGNTSGSATAPQEVSVLDEDDMSSDSATALATQQSIKAFVEKFKPNIVQTVKTDTASTSSTNFTTLMSVSITPKFENSNFKISFSVCTSSTDGNYAPSFRLQRGGSDLTSFLADAAGNRPLTTISTHYPQSYTSQTVSHFTALDSTSYSGLSAITFDLDWAMIQGTGYLNRSNIDADSIYYTRSVSQLMVEEIYQ